MRVHQIDTAHQLEEIESLQSDIWQFEPTAVAPQHVFIAAIRSGGLVLGAYDDTDRLVGFSLAFRGARRARPCLYSHLTGLHPSFRGRGFGFQLKLRQREFARAAGLDSIVWTFDPLMTPNARLNLSKLGGVVYRYIPNAYGASAFRLYGEGFPTHRYELHWHLDRPIPAEQVGSSSLDDDLKDLPTLIEWHGDGRPLLSVDALDNAFGQVLVMPVPLHHLAMRRDNPELAHAWLDCISICSERLIGHSHCVSQYRDLTDRGVFIFQPIADGGEIR